jgi:hypothetical protein
MLAPCARGGVLARVLRRRIVRRTTRSRQRRKGSWSTKNQNVPSAGSGSMKAKVKLWLQPHTRSQPPMRQRNFVPIYAPGVTVGISRKMKEEPERIVDNRLNRPVKWTKFPIPALTWALGGIRLTITREQSQGPITATC